MCRECGEKVMLRELEAADARIVELEQREVQYRRYVFAGLLQTYLLKRLLQSYEWNETESGWWYTNRIEEALSGEIYR